jgi:acyl-[acyl-carrier-protein]-phospholipid O-acyltransferase/long-chain-fatty-acid--[acyl-carrier-protein] ligase
MEPPYVGCYENERIGILLPNVNAMPVVLLSLWFAKKVPAILNYTVGPAILLACARVAELKQIITSKKFIENLNLDLKPFQDSGIRILYLEDVRAGISATHKIAAALFGRTPSSFPQSQDSAVILFTSGSEGDPKAVELTHRNVLANIRQMVSVIDLMENDRFFNALPLFHSFGLTIGLILPLVRGTFVFLYLSPLHYRVVPSAFYNLDCTVLFGTNTFLNGYARKAHPYDFRSLRYLFAGAEKLQESTANVWMRKFGVRIIEGYGATECSPCISANTPMRSKHGSAGQFLPDIVYKLEPVEGVSASLAPSDGERVGVRGQSPSLNDNAGRLFVRGPNIMRGYWRRDDDTANTIVDGWLHTGDLATVDDEGYLYLVDRKKDMIITGGENVFSTEVEAVLYAHPAVKEAAVIGVPDPQWGEAVHACVALKDNQEISADALIEFCRPRLASYKVPRSIEIIKGELPKGGTGKILKKQLRERHWQGRERRIG